MNLEDLGVAVPGWKPVARGAAALLLSALLVGAATPAWAHGGQYRAPGSAPTGPGLNSVPVPQAITPGETWETWWDLNRFTFLPGRDAALRREVVTPGSDGTPEESLESLWAKRRALVARREIVPFLMKLLDPQGKERNEVVAASLIALGKLAQDPAATPLLVHWLEDKKADDMVRESAALAIGLLRRTKKELQADGVQLDILRDHLIRTIDDEKAPVRVRSFAAVALGLLADQPYGSPVGEHGTLIVHALWKRLEQLPSGIDLSIAIFTALGLQDPEGVPDAVREGLQLIVLGQAVLGRRWKDIERSNALTALLRLGGPMAYTLTLKVLRRSREAVELRRAAYLGLGRLAPSWTEEERVKAGKVLLASLDTCTDPLSHGLGLLATGRLLAADLAAGHVELLEGADPTPILFRAEDQGSPGDRGFATIALSIAAGGARQSGLARPFYEKVRALLEKGLVTKRGDDTIRAAYAAGLGLLQDDAAIDLLLDVVRDEGALPVLRGHAAVALGQIGKQRDHVLPALRTVMADRKSPLLRVRAALAAALLGDRDVKDQLLKELQNASTEYHRAHVVIALGRLGDLAVVPDLIAYASDGTRSDLARALGVVALGLVADPEPKPSLLRLTQDANYPSATGVLYEAFAIF